MKLGGTDILIILSFLVHEHGLALHLFNFDFFHQNIVDFLILILTYFVRFKPKYFFMCANVNGIMFLISSSNFSLLLFGKTIDFGY